MFPFLKTLSDYLKYPLNVFLRLQITDRHIFVQLKIYMTEIINNTEEQILLQGKLTSANVSEIQEDL